MSGHFTDPTPAGAKPAPVRRPARAGREPDLTAVSISPGFLLRATYLQLWQLSRQCEAFDFKPAVFELIKLLHDNPGIRQVDAARLLLVHDSNMANLVKELCASGLVHRVKDAFGGRGGLKLTPDGEARLAAATPVAGAIEDSFLAPLAPEERTQLLGLLFQLYLGGQEGRAAAGNARAQAADA